MPDEIVQEFLVESAEGLDSLDQDFIDLENDPSNTSTIASIFRTIHTIKGTSGFLGFTKLERLTHRGENLLSLLREGELQLTKPMTDSLLRMVDAVREILNQIESTDKDGEDDHEALIAELTALVEGGNGNESAPNGAVEEPLAGTDPELDAAIAAMEREAREAEAASGGAA